MRTDEKKFHWKARVNHQQPSSSHGLLSREQSVIWRWHSNNLVPRTRVLLEGRGLWVRDCSKKGNCAGHVRHSRKNSWNNRCFLSHTVFAFAELAEGSRPTLKLYQPSELLIEIYSLQSNETTDGVHLRIDFFSLQTSVTLNDATTWDSGHGRVSTAHSHVSLIILILWAVVNHRETTCNLGAKHQLYSYFKMFLGPEKASFRCCFRPRKTRD